MRTVTRLDHPDCYTYCMPHRLLTYLLLSSLTPAMAEVLTGTDAEAQLPFWELRVPGMVIAL